MSRITATFDKLRAEGRQALIPFVTAGYPFAAITPNLMHGMVEAGADIIELGVPFSDPMADGPVIQKAGEKALSLGIGMVQVLEHVREFRKRNHTTPVVLMGYANPVERYDQLHGTDAFVNNAAAAGVDGVLIVDYPPEECVDFAAKLRAKNMDLIFLLAPHRRAHGRSGTRGHRLRLLRLAQGRDRLGSTRHLGGRSHAAQHP